MPQNNLKQRLKSGQVIFGSWCIIPSAPLVEVIGASGLDFFIIDAEHGPMSMETAADMLCAADAAGVPALMRLPNKDAHFILRALDIGVHGVQVPHVSTAAEARAVVEAAKYYPKGKRGFSPFTRAAKYGLYAKEYPQEANKNTLIVLNIEGAEGVKNLDSIAGIADIDVIFIGPYDLSQSLGKTGKVTDPQVVSAIKRAVKVAKNKGIACGSFARDEEYLDILISCGVQYITYGVDTSLILNNYKALKSLFTQKLSKRKK